MFIKSGVTHLRAELAHFTAEIAEEAEKERIWMKFSAFSAYSAVNSG